MKKDFSKLNYYEMLDISPDAAFFEIRHAYNNALQIYGPDSMVSYSLFTQEERNKILELLEKAYLTLINAQERKKYDAQLAQAGVIPPVAGKVPQRKPAVLYDAAKPAGTGAMPRKMNKAIWRESAEKNKRIAEILSCPVINGAALKSIRMELGAPLERIAQETRVRLEYLGAIEEDKIDRLPAAVFLKGFVKAYLKSLCLEPVDDICTRYMQWFEQAKKSG